MNITQKKYAIKRVEIIIQAKIKAIKAKDLEAFRKYQKAIKLPVTRIVEAIRLNQVVPFPKTVLKSLSDDTSLSAVYDLSKLEDKALVKSGIKLLPEKDSIKVDIPVLGVSIYATNMYLFYSKYASQVEDLLDTVKQLTDEIMLGNDVTATLAISAAENL